jgi:hypothetical protein
MAQQNMLVEAGVMLPQIVNPVPLGSYWKAANENTAQGNSRKYG